MRFRGKSIRQKIVVLLLVPLVSLVSIWAFATYITTGQAAGLLNSEQTAQKVGDPTEDVVEALQRERRQTLVYLADPRGSDALTRLRTQERDTNARISQLRANSRDSEVRSDLSDRSRASLGQLLDKLQEVKKIRAGSQQNTLTRGGAFQAYNSLVDPCYAFLSALSGIGDDSLDKEGRALVGLDRAREFLSREDALMAAALASGKMTSGDRRAFSDRIAERNLSYDFSLQYLPPAEKQLFENFWDGTDGRTLRSYEDAIIAAGPRGASSVVGAARWDSATSSALDDLAHQSFKARNRYQQRVQPLATEVMMRAGAAGVLGALAVVASLIVSLRVGRGLVRDLSTLRREAQEAAGVRLPSVMRRLAAGEEVDVETEAPRLEYGQDETGQVGRAVNTLQRAAVEAAVKQADMRKGVSEVFVNLARRSQVLLHRQLTLLDTMERRTEDSDELADLFRLDHLTTRMRRHAEGLVILSGAAPSRQWRKPIQLMDVVRAAVAEVEDYERIEVRRLARLALDGGSVADLTHLIAELMENATVFSPPHTAVRVEGERVANGFLLEIHDRGLGMAPEALLDANLRLAETPEFELSDTDRLGLFVVSRLAQRQGVRVSLQKSPYGGTTAVVLIPGSILTETSSEREESGGAVKGGPRRRGIAGGGGEKEASRELERSGELDSALGELESGAGHDLFRHTERSSGTRGERGWAPGEQHQQASDETAASRPTDEAGHETDSERPAPLPRRNRPSSPVLIADHGRTVGGGDPRTPRPQRQPQPEGPAPQQQPEQRPQPSRPEPSRAQQQPDQEQPDQQQPDEQPPRPRQTQLPQRQRQSRRQQRPETQPPRTPQQAPAPPAEEPAPAPERPAPAPPAGGGRPATTAGGLPRRVRQASLAPQLKRDDSEDAARRGGQGSKAGRGQADLEARDADQVRSRMASLQRGWQRGRAQSADTPDTPDAPHHEAGDKAPGTTPEGDGR
jgi:anti-sigma regulatory factor (Ser/Thr protein kinase)